MVRNYVRKSDRQKWDPDVMKLALEEISNGMPFKRAAKIFNLPLTSLKRRAKGQNKMAKGHIKHLGRYVTTLSREIEIHLRDYALEMEDRLFGLTKKNICEMAYELAEKNKINHRFSHTRKAAGTAWFQDFLQRHPELSFKTPEATSAARARGFNKEAVAKFFSILDEVTTANAITDPMRIFNMDEAGIQTVPSKVPKIVAHKGRKQVGHLTSAERGQSVSIALCVNAAGQYVPPAIIFPRKRRNELLFQGVPHGTLCLQNESEYMKSDTFVQFLQHFQKHTHCTVDNKVLLLLDGHSTHRTLEAIEYSRKNGIILLSFPPHCTHEMQPLDVAVFAPFMTYYNEELSLWLKANPGRIVTLYNIGAMFGKAYRRAATLNNGLSGFEKTGIFPMNPNVFPDWRFKPSATTERPMANDVDNLIEGERTPSPQPRSSGAHKIDKKRRTLSTSSSEESSEEWQASGRSSDDVTLFGNDDADNQSFDGALDPIPQVKPSSDVTVDKIVTPFDIAPPPVAPSGTRSSRPSQGATVFTSTPNYVVTKEKAKGTRPKASQKSKKAVQRKVFPGSKAKSKTQVDDKNTDDASCIYCLELFSESAAKEKWVKCNVCKKWAHDLCAGVTPKQKNFVCEFCV